MTNFKLDVDADGIALITWDMPDRSMNVITMEAIGEFTTIVEKVATDAAIKSIGDHLAHKEKDLLTV